MDQSQFVTVSIYDSSCLRSLLEWTICDVNDERMTVEAFYQIALSTCTCDPGVLAEVKHCLEEAKIGKTIVFDSDWEHRLA